jgi:hypothetical protein
MPRSAGSARQRSTVRVLAYALAIRRILTKPDLSAKDVALTLIILWFV